MTVIDSDLKTAYEALVRPEHKIVDYNTRFSGVTRQQMHGVTTTLRDVQAVLLSMFRDNTILIGHSLESDFIALKVIVMIWNFSCCCLDSECPVRKLRVCRYDIHCL